MNSSHKGVADQVSGDSMYAAFLGEPCITEAAVKVMILCSHMQAIV